MSDGVEECNRESDIRVSHPDDYSRAVSKIAVAQICESVGFDCVKQSALEAVSDVAIRYICDLGKSASLYASLAGRSEVNVFDMIEGLEGLGSTSYFLGDSGLDHSVGSSSSVVNEMTKFVGTVEEIPFAQPIPRFPVIKSRRGIPSFSQMGEVLNGKHIPDWLPAFPDPHTYIHSPMWNERKTVSRTNKVEHVKQRRKAEKSLLSLQRRLLSNGLAGASGSGYYHADSGNDFLGAPMENNPYLTLPLPSTREKDDPTVDLPPKVVTEEGEKKRVTVLETFGPAIDAMKGGGGVSDPMDLDRRVIPERRPVVHFKLKAGKKMMIEDLDVNLRNHSKEKKASWVGRDDEKDDKKRRAELILRQSMENAQELSQM